MPRYDWVCPAGHVTEVFRSIARRNEPLTCSTCGAEMMRTVSAPHVEPDGMYSYAENLGNADQFERRLQAMKDGKRVYKKEA